MVAKTPTRQGNLWVRGCSWAKQAASEPERGNDGEIRLFIEVNGTAGTDPPHADSSTERMTGEMVRASPATPL